MFGIGAIVIDGVVYDDLDIIPESQLWDFYKMNIVITVIFGFAMIIAIIKVISLFINRFHQTYRNEPSIVGIIIRVLILIGLFIACLLTHSFVMAAIFGLYSLVASSI